MTCDKSSGEAAKPAHLRYVAASLGRSRHDTSDYISIASATSMVPCSRCGQSLAIFRATSMLSAFMIENPVKRSDPPLSDTALELTFFCIPIGYSFTSASPILPTQTCHVALYCA